jgi:pantoate--beta-alanine ligase
MSSRNAYLDAEARSAAPRIRAALLAARTRVLEGETHTAAVLDRLREVLRPDALLELEYAEVRDATTLQEFPDGVVRRTPGGVVIAVAARAKGTRLIDNVVILPDGRASP